MSKHSKLSKVLEYLVKNDEEKAKELLHQVFIEKARAIHEEMMSNDEMEENDLVGGSGDEGKDFRHDVNARGHDEDRDEDDADIRGLQAEIDFEETMNEENDEEMDMEMDVDSDIDEDDEEMDMKMDVDSDAEDGGENHGDHEQIIKDKMGDLETALAELKAEFEMLEAEENGEGDEEEGDASEVEEESWEMDEDFNDIAESLDLEVVTKDMEKSVPAADVGSAKSGMSDGNKARSPVPPSQTTRFGAKPVAIGDGPDHNGYERQAAPKSSMDALKIGDPDMKDDNRRKTAATGSSRMDQKGNKPSAKLNTTASEFGAGNSMSPLSKGGQNLK